MCLTKPEVSWLVLRELPWCMDRAAWKPSEVVVVSSLKAQAILGVDFLDVSSILLALPFQYRLYLVRMLYRQVSCFKRHYGSLH